MDYYEDDYDIDKDISEMLDYNPDLHKEDYERAFGKGSSMNTSITLEQVQQSLDNNNIPYKMLDVDEQGFSRVFKFNILGVVYYINWWSNISYLSVGCRYANSFPFTKISKAPSHPSFNNAIAFCMKGKEDFHDKFHVGLSLYSWQKGE